MVTKGHDGQDEGMAHAVMNCIKEGSATETQSE